MQSIKTSVFAIEGFSFSPQLVTEVQYPTDLRDPSLGSWCVS